MESKVFDELLEQISQLKNLYLQIKDVEEKMYDSNLQYVDGTLELHEQLEKEFEKLSQSIALWLCKYSKSKNINFFFQIMQYSVLMPFLRYAMPTIKLNTKAFNALKETIKAHIRETEIGTQVLKEANELKEERLCVTSKTKQIAHNTKLNMLRRTDTEVWGEILGKLISEIRDEELEYQFKSIEEVEKLIIDNPDFMKFFIKNTKKVLENIEYTELLSLSFPFAYENMLKHYKLREAILNNLDTISARTSWREGMVSFLKCLPQEERIKYAESLFAKSTNIKACGIQYDYIINALIGMGVPKEHLLKLIEKNINNIIVDAYRNSEALKAIAQIINETKDSMKEKEHSRLVESIDTFLADNIELLMQRKEEDRKPMQSESGYTSESFDLFKKVQAEIRRRGIEVFNSELYIGENNIEECTKAAQKYFGTAETKAVIALMYGGLGKDRVDVIAGIIEELQGKQGFEKTLTQESILGAGHASTAIVVGDYVVKIGKYRHIEKMPNDRRLLQPIIRQRLPGVQTGERKEPFVEVQNKVERNWTEGLTEEEIEEELYKIYKEMRNRGHIFSDISPENIGRLIKENRPNYEFRDIDGQYKDIRPTEEATGLEGEESEEDMLKPGELVILDTDFVFNDKKGHTHIEAGWIDTIVRYRKFTERYELEKSKETRDNSQERE